MRPKISFANVTKTYNLYRKENLKLFRFLFSRKSKNPFHAVYNVSFDIFEGETVGIIGLNGAGKSTLSNLLAQVVPPSKGEIYIDGTPSLIAIGAGLNGVLTGLENIYMKCYINGMSKKEVDILLPEIIKFAEIGDFINQPVKSYSSGMKSRLGFAISIHLNPDIIIIDEALSVGDSTFYKKCLNKMNEFKAQGKTIIFISHADQQIKSFCDRVIWLEYGEIRKIGNADEVVEEYREFVREYNAYNEEEKALYKQQHSVGQFISTKKTLVKEKFEWSSLYDSISNVVLVFIFTLLVCLKAFLG